jgi:short-subunit dehydrogenase
MKSVQLLSGMKAFVAGATGEVGKGAAVALWQQGADVYIAGRNAQKLNDIKSTFMNNDDARVHVMAVDYSTVDGAHELERLVSSQNLTFDVVVSSSGPWWNVGKFHDLDLNTLDAAMRSNIYAHMHLYRVLVARCKRQYICVNGAAAKMLPNTSLTGVCANAVLGWSKVVHAECSADEALPEFTHALIASSVGHGATRGQTNDSVDFGRLFVAMALGKHTVDSAGTIEVNDNVYQSLVQKL